MCALHQENAPPAPSHLAQVLRLCCASYICDLLQKELGETDCYSVADLLIRNIEKERVIGQRGVDVFVSEIHRLDDEFPTALLRNVYQFIMPKLAHVHRLVQRDQHLCVGDLGERSEATHSKVKDSVDDSGFPPVNTLQQRLEAISSVTLGGISHATMLRGDSGNVASSVFPSDLRSAPGHETALDESMPQTEEDRFEQRQLQRALASPSSPVSPSVDTEADALTERDVRIRAQLPQFLKKETNVRSVAAALRATHSATVVKDPRGSLVQGILRQQMRIKERREVKRAMGIPTLRGSTAPPAHRQEMGNIPWHHQANAPLFTLNCTQGFRNKDRSIEEQRKMLKIYDKKQSFLEAVEKSQVLIVLGETGSGKTTQMTQYLAEAGYVSKNQIIGCTQPRRLPARSVAERVALEYGCRVGEEVGYTVRFDDETSRRTIIKYLTDGILLREALADPSFSRYRVLIIDEAHERNINTDVLLGLLKQVLRKGHRPDLRLIVTSATLNVHKFSEFFDAAPIFTIPGRSYPVEEIYSEEPCEDYIYESVLRVIEIHLTAPEGDILVFLPGKEEIEDVCERLRSWEEDLPKEIPRVEVHMIYATLPTETQSRVFLPAPLNTRKVILATNIAETSVTIDGIVYVVDPGVFKQKVFNPTSGMEVLRVTPISQAQANQRKGRAGRTGPGRCYRLYTLHSFQNEMLPEPVPEIQRSNLSNVVLTMKATGIMDILGFDFIDPPPREILVDALNKLYALGALDNEGLLTQQGRRMAQYPIDPTLSTVLLTASSLGCAEEVLTVVSVLTSEDLFYRPKEKSELADTQRQRLQQKDGDHMTMLHIYQQWEKNGCNKQWCESHFIHFRALKYAREVREELWTVMHRQGLRVTGTKNAADCSMLVRQSFTSGFFMNVARRQPDGSYRTMLDHQSVYLHPSGALFHRPPPWVLYQSVVITTKEYMRDVSPIDMRWLVLMAPRYFSFATKSDLDSKREREKIEPLFNKFVGPGEWRWTQSKRNRR